jgi:transposase-like protein
MEMNIQELRKKLKDEDSCRALLESLIWQNGRVCPHCGGAQSWLIKGKTARRGLYECACCHSQFTVTTKTPMHSTKLPLMKWFEAMYFILRPSKGTSSKGMAALIGVSQKTAWKIDHGIREMMNMSHIKGPVLRGIVELDEKYLGGKPRKTKGVNHKRGKGTGKQAILVMAERKGQIRAMLIKNDSYAEIAPLVKRHVHSDAHLMTDQNSVYPRIAKDFAGHSCVNHGNDEFARGKVHNNTAESFNAQLERAKFGIFHWLSKKHLQRYIDEAVFRWNHRQPVEKFVPTCGGKGKWKIVMEPMPFMDQLKSLLSCAIWRQVRFTKNSSIRVCSNYV